MTRTTVEDVPNQPKTPQRTFRAGRALWDKVKAKAKRKGFTASDVIRMLLEKWVDEPDDESYP